MKMLGYSLDLFFEPFLSFCGYSKVMYDIMNNIVVMSIVINNLTVKLIDAGDLTGFKLSGWLLKFCCLKVRP